MPQTRSFDAILRELLDFVRQNYGRHALRVIIEDSEGEQFRLPMPRTVSDPTPVEMPAFQEPWVPTDFQNSILDALAGKALRTDALLAKLRTNRGQLFRKPTGGIKELMDQGAVRNHPRLGYYSVDEPPPELDQSSDQSGD